jgi:dTDP-glucose pyrophosphorylase
MRSEINWKKTIINQNDTIGHAIEILERESLRIVLVVGRHEKLLGTITDGDIRRAMLKSYGMSTVVEKIMNSRPIVASINDDRQRVLHMMKSRDLHIPLVDTDGVLVGLETLQKLTDQPSNENIVFLMAGGFGMRLRPLTLDIPKPLLKVGNKPILETILEQFADSGFRNFYISTHYKAEMVRNFFGNGEKWGVKIQYVYEENPMGTAGALSLLPVDIPDLPIIVMNGDLLTKVNFDHLLQFHSEQKGIATMCVREYDIKVPYGVVETDGRKITGIVEKPVQRFFVNAGIYVLDYRLVKKVGEQQYLDMPDLLEKCVEDNQDVIMYPVHEYWLDIGNLPDYQRANDDAGSFFSEPDHR